MLNFNIKFVPFASGQQQLLYSANIMKSVATASLLCVIDLQSLDIEALYQQRRILVKQLFAVWASGSYI